MGSEAPCSAGTLHALWQGRGGGGGEREKEGPEGRGVEEWRVTGIFINTRSPLEMTHDKNTPRKLEEVGYNKLFIYTLRETRYKQKVLTEDVA